MKNQKVAIEKMGVYISEQRRAKNMSQKELADCVGVTDKAVSKWERGLSYPDITLLAKIGDTLDVSIQELFQAEQIEQLAEYSEGKTHSLRKSVFRYLTLAMLTIAFICFICNVLVSPMIVWAPYPIGAVLSVWVALLPFFKYRERKVLLTLVFASLAVCSYLTMILLLVSQNYFCTLILISVDVIIFVVVYVRTRRYLY